MDTASSDADGLTYLALDNGPTIESLAVLNRDLNAAQLPNVTVGEAPTVTLCVTRRSALHRWWDHEVMICHLGGTSFTNISSSSKSTVPHFEPKMLARARDTLGASGVIRAYAGLKYLDMPILKGRISASYWNEEFCDDTKLLLTATNIPERGGTPTYFNTLDALRDYFLEDANDFLARDLAEYTLLEFLVEGVNVYHETLGSTVWAQVWTCEALSSLDRPV